MPHVNVHVLSDISPCVEYILAELVEIGLSEERIKDIRLCLLELLSNAVRHGHPANEVRLHYHIGQALLALQIYEVGSCWEGSQAEDERAAHCVNAGLLDEGGRGLFLVNLLADGFSYCENCKGICATIRLY